MRIAFRRSGGFAAPSQRLEITVDTAALAREEAEEAESLVRSASAKGASMAAARAPDAFYYRVTVQDGEHEVTLSATDMDMPDTLRPLVDWLERRAGSRERS